MAMHDINAAAFIIKHQAVNSLRVKYEMPKCDDGLKR
jgi:hypothetical protein